MHKVKKNNSFNTLRQLYLLNNKNKYPTLPDYARFAPLYTDKTTNGLTKCVTDFLKLNHCFVERTGNQGRIIDNRKRFTDSLGNIRTTGTLKRIYSTSKRGTSDLKAIINGKFVAIEIKCLTTNDRQSKYQKKYQKEVEQAGGIYLIVPTFECFYTWFIEYTKGANHE